MELEELVASLKMLKETENLKFYAYLANSEAKDEIFETGLQLYNKTCSSLFFKLDEKFYQEPTKFIEREIGAITNYGLDTLYIVATSQKRLSMLFRREKEIDENGEQIIKISQTNVIGSFNLNDYYFEQNNESVLHLYKVSTLMRKNND